MDQTNPAWLTEVLRAHGHLAAGEVWRITVAQSFETPPSTIARLAVEYSSDTPPGAPTRLFLKMPKPHKLARGAQEVRFYQNVAPLAPSVPLLPCYGSGADSRVQAVTLELPSVVAGAAGPIARLWRRLFPGAV